MISGGSESQILTLPSKLPVNRVDPVPETAQDATQSVPMQLVNGQLERGKSTERLAPFFTVTDKFRGRDSHQQHRIDK